MLKCLIKVDFPNYSIKGDDIWNHTARGHLTTRGVTIHSAHETRYLVHEIETRRDFKRREVFKKTSMRKYMTVILSESHKMEIMQVHFEMFSYCNESLQFYFLNI